jgi:acetyl esterase/lipase
LFHLILRARRPLVDWEAPVEYFRAMMRRSERFFRPPPDVATGPETAGPVPGEWLTPPGAPDRPALLYLHGGGWTLGWTNIHRRMVAHLGKAAGVRAFAVDYRLAPEHPFLAALDDCLAAYRWLLGERPPREVVIAGDSAGGNLALACLLALRDAGDPLPAAAVCLSPMTDLEGTGASFHTRRDVALTPEFALNMARHYASGRDVRDPLLSPYHGDVRGLPPLLIPAVQRPGGRSFSSR